MCRPDLIEPIQQDWHHTLAPSPPPPVLSFFLGVFLFCFHLSSLFMTLAYLLLLSQFSCRFVMICHLRSSFVHRSSIAKMHHLPYICVAYMINRLSLCEYWRMRRAMGTIVVCKLDFIALYTMRILQIGVVSCLFRPKTMPKTKDINNTTTTNWATPNRFISSKYMIHFLKLRKVFD